MARIVSQNVDEVVEGLKSEIPKIAKDILHKISEHVEEAIVGDYNRRCQQISYPIRHPVTGLIITNMEPKDIAKKVIRSVELEQNRAIIYLPPGTKADKEARIQELYGCAPWKYLRSRMRDVTYMNRILSVKGLQGIKARSK